MRALLLMFVSCAEGVVVVQKRIAPSCATWLPRSKAPKRRLRHWPEARPLWVGYGAVSSVVFGLTIASAIKYALPGVVEYTRKSISPWSVGANALVGRCVSVRAYTVTASALISAGARKRIGKGIELSTQAPLLSDFALDAGRHPKQHYRLLTYWLFHANLPHVLFDAFFLRYALSTRSNARTRDDLPVCGRSILPLALVGVYAGGLAHRCFGGKSRALGLAGANAALLGAALAADVKLQQASEAWPVFARVMVLGMGTLIFGSSGLPVGAGFLSGFLFGEATGPQVVVKEDTYVLRRDQEAKFKRSFAPKIEGSISLGKPIIKPRLALAILLLLIPPLRGSLRQLPQALYLAAADPGALSRRVLAPPPKFAWW